MSMLVSTSSALLLIGKGAKSSSDKQELRLIDEMSGFLRSNHGLSLVYTIINRISLVEMDTLTFIVEHDF